MKELLEGGMKVNQLVVICLKEQNLVKNEIYQLALELDQKSPIIKFMFRN